MIPQPRMTGRDGVAILSQVAVAEVQNGTSQKVGCTKSEKAEGTSLILVGVWVKGECSSEK